MTGTAVNVVTRIAMFAAALVAVFAVSAWVGGTFGPEPDSPVPHSPSTSEHLPAHGEAGQ